MCATLLKIILETSYAIDVTNTIHASSSTEVQRTELDDAPGACKEHFKISIPAEKQLKVDMPASRGCEEHIDGMSRHSCH